jgi:hypothetical protein
MKEFVYISPFIVRKFYNLPTSSEIIEFFFISGRRMSRNLLKVLASFQHLIYNRIYEVKGNDKPCDSLFCAGTQKTVGNDRKNIDKNLSLFGVTGYH